MWEHKTDIKYDRSLWLGSQGEADYLNAQGAEGWQLVSTPINVDRPDGDVYLYYFKRHNKMAYNIISPLGERPGIGTYNSVYNKNKFGSFGEAVGANEFIVIDFVQNDAMSNALRVYSSKCPDDMKLMLLADQDISKDVSERDEVAVMEIVLDLLRQF